MLGNEDSSRDPGRAAPGDRRLRVRVAKIADS
jgi:hypothetical protein